MKKNNLISSLFAAALLILSIYSFAQDFVPKSVKPSGFNKALELYESSNFVAAEKQFIDLTAKVQEGDPVIFDLEYYRLMCLVKQNKKTTEAEITMYLNKDDGNPWTNQLWYELAKQQFNSKKYKIASGTFNKVEPSRLPKADLEDYKFYNAYSNLESGNRKKALQGFYEVKRGSSIYAPSASYYWAYINYLDGNYEAALEEFTKIEKNPKFSAFIPYYTIQIYYLQGKYDYVIEKGESFIDLATGDQRNELTKILGDAYYEKGRFIQAIKYLDEYKGVGGKRTREDFYRLGYCYYQIKDYKKAIAAFDKVTLQNDAMAQNAYYHLADCFLQTNDKNKARVAFERASQSNFNPKIEEDALFNFAKLTYELSYSPFNETIKAFDAYITKYPNSERNDAAFDYLVKVYMTTKNYKDAISSIEKIKVKSPSVKEALQRVTYFRALELFNDGNYNESINTFTKALENASYNRTYSALSLYWIAEARYRTGKYKEAIDAYTKFQSSPGAFSLPEFNTAYYSIAYSYFELEDHEQSATWFRKYVTQNKTIDKLKADAYNRLGDCYYVNRNYEESEKYYSMSVAMRANDPDYALFQRANISGINHGWDKKISDLQTLITTYPRSSFVDDSYFEMARTYERQQEIEQAVSTYQKLIAQQPTSPYVKKALLQLGLIYYNRDDSKNSLIFYKQVVEKYPDSEESKAALIGIKNNYVDMNDVDGYFTYIKQTGNKADAIITTSAQDSIFYMAAERNYMSGGSNPGAQFEEYLRRYPDGSFRTSATFYLAETHYDKKEFSKSLSLYEEILALPDNIFTEQALTKAGELMFNAAKYEKALNYFLRLEQISSTKWNTLKAKAGIMRCYYQMEQWPSTVKAAVGLLASDRVTELMIREANYKLAKSHYNLNETNEAYKYFSLLATDVKSAEGAESKYMKAKILYAKNNLADCENEVLDFIEVNTPHQYWLAKAFILLSDVYSARNDSFQAKHTLKSIIENYTLTTDGIISEATEKLSILENKEKESILNSAEPNN